MLAAAAPVTTSDMIEMWCRAIFQPSEFRSQLAVRLNCQFGRSPWFVQIKHATNLKLSPVNLRACRRITDVDNVVEGGVGCKGSEERAVLERAKNALIQIARANSARGLRSAHPNLAR